jgi:heptose I phosphotransferase
MNLVPLWGRLCHGIRRLHARADWVKFVGADWAARIMAAEVTDDFHAKQGRSTGRWLLQSEGQQLAVYLKRHYRLPRWQGWLATLWPGGDWSPALQERRHLDWARSQGLPVPAVVAAGEYLGPWGRLQSFLAIEELTGMMGLHQAIPLAAQTLAPAAFARWKAGLVREVARLARFLHDRRYFHKDLYLCHFYIPLADITDAPVCWPGRLHMIDLHRLAHHWLSWPVWLVKDLGQLLYSSDVEGIDARDRMRFWRAYLGPMRHSCRAWLLARGVLLKGGRYRRHNRRRMVNERAA